MRNARGTLLQGAFCGGFAAAGLMFVLLWQMILSAPNAGAMVDGQFRPYQGDPVWHIFLVGGAILIAGGVAGFVVAWRKLPE